MELPKKLPQFIWHFLKKQWALFLIVQLLCFGWSLDTTLWPVAMKLFIDKFVAFSGDKTQIWQTIWPILVLWGSLWIGVELTFRSAGFILARALPKFAASVRMAMFNYATGHSYDYFSNHFAGSVSNRISDMTQSSTRIVQVVISLFIPVFAALLISIVIFFTLNWLFALLLLSWSMLHLGLCFFFAKRCATLSKIHSNSRSLLTGKIVDALTNIINVKLFTRRRYEYEDLAYYQQDEKRKYTLSNLYIEKLKIALGLSSLLFPGVLLTWYTVYSWQKGYITIGDLVLIFNTSWNIQSLAWHAGLELPQLFKEIGTCQQALEVIQTEHEIKDKKDAPQLQVSNGSIEFNNVSFHYIKNNCVFKNLSVTITGGSKVGLVGFSGSGKSTFVNLIMRFFDTDSGEIRIDGQTIHEVTVDSLRSKISMIPQNPTLFHRTLKENIRYGKITATNEEIMTAARHAHCHEFIEKLPDRYDALVGERGIKLSGGQRQRVAIARAILENAPILILDEATSALDSVTEKTIQEALHFLMEGKTTIVVAHRLSTLSEMDRILVFDRGCIVEDGSHQELLATGGHYAKMWHMQAGGFLPDTIEETVDI